MFVTRKRFEELIERAKREKEEQMWKDAEQRDAFRRVNERLDEIQYGNTRAFCPPPIHEVYAERAVGVLASVLEKLIDNKEKFNLTDDDAEILEAKDLLERMEGVKSCE